MRNRFLHTPHAFCPAGRLFFRHAAGLLAVVSLAAALAQPQEAPQRLRSIEGKVVRLPEQAPAEGVEIHVFGAPRPLSVRTDASGRFRIEGLSPGRYGLMTAPWSGYRAPEVPVDLRYREKIEGLMIPLRRAARISGRIRNHEGQGLASIAVSALRDPGRDAWRIPDRAAIARTDGEGRFTLEGLDQGAYLLLAEPPAPQWRLRDWSPDDPLPEPSKHAVPTYYPGVGERTLASSVALLAGEDRGGAEWELAEARTYCLQGKAPRDGPAALELTHDLYLGSASIAKTTLESGQAWEVCGLAPGRFVLSASKDSGAGASPVPLFAVIPVEVSDRSLRIGEFSFQTPLIQKVRVRLEKEKESEAQPFPAPLRLWIEPAGRPPFEFEKPMLAAPRPGLFELGPVAGGPSLLNLRTPPGYYAVSAAMDGADVLRKVFHPGGHPLEVVLGSDPAELLVQTVDEKGRPVGYAAVLLGRDPFPDYPWAADLFVSESDQDGVASLSGIPPGRYRVLALPSGTANLVNGATLFRSSFGDAERIELSARGRHSIRATVRSSQR